MLATFNALMPVFLIIALGAAMKRTGFPGDGFWETIDRATYFIFFPCLLFTTLATADLSQVDFMPMASALAAGQITLALVALAIRRPLGLSGPEFSSMFQGTVRWNSFVAVAAAQALFGQAGVTLTSVGIAVLVPVANVLSVYILTKYATDHPASFGRIVKTLARNPLIIACALGISVNALGIPLPTFLTKTTGILGSSTLTLGLVAVGGGLVFNNIWGNKLTVAVTSVLKLLVMPALVFFIGTALRVDETMMPIAMICACVPGATSSYILARQLGGDATLMASLITAGTVAALITMPTILSLI